MMKKNLMFLAFAALGVAGCNGGFNKGEGGLLYKIYIDKDGPKINEGDFISVNIVAKTDGDSVLFSTYQTGYPSYTLLPASHHKGDLNDALKLLAEGDSATIKTNIDSIYADAQVKPPFKSKYINYEVKVEKLIVKGNLTPPEFNGKVISFTNAQTEMLRKAEPGKIKKYIADNKLNGTTTPSGLFYTITKPGTGDKPGPGDTVEVYYVAKYVNNQFIATNIRDTAIKNKKLNPIAAYKPSRFPIEGVATVPAWNEGLQLLNKGAKAIFVASSNIAYAKNGKQGVQPSSPIVFEMELVDIKHPAPNVKKPVAK